MVAAVSNTAYGIINDAMHDAGLISSGQLPNSDQLAENLRRLCDIINVEQTQGLKLFTWTDLSITLIEGQTDYKIGPGQYVDMNKPFRAIQGYVLNTANVRRPLVELSWNDWMLLSQVTGNNSTISSFFVNKQQTYLEVKFWNPPDALEALNTAHLLIQQQAGNPINLEENVTFPQEWRIFLRWALADDISTGQPVEIMRRCQQKAEQYRELLENWDVEDAPTTFTPSTRIQEDKGNFQ